MKYPIKNCNPRGASVSGQFERTATLENNGCTFSQKILLNFKGCVRVIVILIAMVLFALISLVCSGSENPTSLYEAAIPVNTKSPEELQRVLPQALSNVLIKLTGDPEVMKAPGIKSYFSKAQQFVEQYRYLTPEKHSDNHPYLLSVTFSKDEILELLQKTGQKIDPQKKLPYERHQLILTITGVDTPADYIALNKYFQELELVSDLQVVTAAADQIEFQLTVDGSLSMLLEQLKKQPHLQSINKPDEQPESHLYYHYVS